MSTQGIGCRAQLGLLGNSDIEPDEGGFFRVRLGVEDVLFLWVEACLQAGLTVIFTYAAVE